MAAMAPTIFTLEQLKQFDGKAGKQAYVAVNGKIYECPEVLSGQTETTKGSTLPAMT